jgi:hypothetical protein
MKDPGVKDLGVKDLGVKPRSGIKGIAGRADRAAQSGTGTSNVFSVTETRQ